MICVSRLMSVLLVCVGIFLKINSGVPQVWRPISELSGRDVAVSNVRYIPYSGKLLREKTFTNWRKIRFSWSKLSRIAR